MKTSYFLKTKRNVFGDWKRAKQRTGRRMSVIWMLLFLAALWIGVGMQAFLNGLYGPRREEALVEAFARLSTKRLESNLTVLAECPQGFQNYEERVRAMDAYARGLGLVIDGAIEKRESADRTEFSYTKNGKFAQTTLKSISLSGEDACTEYWLLRLKIYQDTDDILRYQVLAEELCERVGYDILQTRVTLFGHYEGELSVEERDCESSMLLESLSAQSVFASRKPEDYTIYAYTPEIGTYVISAGEKINLQIIMEYDPETNKTNITVASPVVG